ncbi:hypothetical protein G6O67_001581 [Ophiocordyceps sinensis]|uniref:Uncharacterized protein n=1 Tax=Ophiocordyceps sinensis TaxID=72228 RepID=A0A8H4PXQ7_9HYPO|nr:hypothetical protein G6O67_001581 [Ophiocordyceps sinensis]
MHCKHSTHTQHTQHTQHGEPPARAHSQTNEAGESNWRGGASQPVRPKQVPPSSDTTYLPAWAVAADLFSGCHGSQAERARRSDVDARPTSSPEDDVVVVVVVANAQ